MSKTRDNTMVEWNNINWRQLERVVFKLQKRIFRASQRGDLKAVRRLQKTLMKSWGAKLIAVRRVTQDNNGKKTAGVDGVKSLTPKQRLSLAGQLKLGTKAQATRRVWIPKPGKEEKRPLGIPTIKDRALQALVKLALEPEWEALFEPNSYGFRPGRSCHDAIGAIFDAIKQKPKYVLDADIAKCFDKIDHQQLLKKLNTFPTMSRQIKAWLKAGVIDTGRMFNTSEGTPQGGTISPLLANIALHGMEERIKQFAKTLKGKKIQNTSAISLIRYADDFVILHKDITVVTRCREIISEWLLDMGLELKSSKTRVAHTLLEYNGEQPGFNFLGFNIRQYKVSKYDSKKGFKTLIKPSDEKVKTHYDRLSSIIDTHKAAPQGALISRLNPVIAGWANYYSTQVSKDTYSKLDHLLYKKLARWAKRRHPNKSGRWVTAKYWRTLGNNHWTFSDGKIVLKTHGSRKIERHVKVEGMRSPFDGDQIYWSTRLGKHPEVGTGVTKLLKKQKGKCTRCRNYFRDGDLMEVDHTVPKSKGGKDTYDNLQLLHKHCHDQKTHQDGSLDQLKSRKTTQTELPNWEDYLEETGEFKW
jgi:RNA-directed DNA polymerase